MALFGILCVNIFSLGASDILRDEFLMEWRMLPLEKMLLFLRSNFIDNRIFPILSFLFGLSASWQIQRIIESKQSVNQILFKRYFVLLIFGLIHLFLIWWGDVLIWYVVCGFALILLRT